MKEENPIAQSIDWLVECGWDRKQATNLAAAIKADSPEKLWEVAPLWLEHCGESMRYVTAMLGSVAMGLIEVTQGENGEWLFKLNDKGMDVGKKLNEEKNT
jgi:hypothetical protein